MLRPSDVAALETHHGPEPGEGSGPTTSSPSSPSRPASSKPPSSSCATWNGALRLEAENTELRSKVPDLQSVLAATWRSLSAAMGESVNVLTMPDTPND
jgi:hypothetical protein